MFCPAKLVALSATEVFKVFFPLPEHLPTLMVFMHLACTVVRFQGNRSEALVTFTCTSGSPLDAAAPCANEPDRRQPPSGERDTDTDAEESALSLLS